MPPPSEDPRWKPLAPDPAAGGSLSVFYSDPLAAVPVREVTRLGDNKADPNLETGTYGLFSTCGRATRAGIVRDRRPFLFFTSSWGGQRVLAGYYRLGWYACTPSPAARDFALAAESVRFDADPLPLATVDDRLGTRFSRRFRSALTLSEEEASRLANLLDGRPDGTGYYLAEVDRLERFNQCHGGHRYNGWGRDEPFTWADADARLADGPQAPNGKVSNASPSGWWACTAPDCAHTFENRSRLRICPSCGAAGTLAPLDEAPDS